MAVAVVNIIVSISLAVINIIIIISVPVEMITSNTKITVNLSLELWIMFKL